MKLSIRLILIATGAVVGLAVLAGFALNSLHDIMLTERKAGISLLAKMMTGKQVEHFQKLSGKADSTVQSIHEAAHSTSEQSGATDSVVGNVEGIVQMEEMATSVTAAEHNARLLEDWAVHLRDSVPRFRME